MGTNIDARYGVWNTVSGNQYNTYNTIQSTSFDLDALRKVSAVGAGYNSSEREPAPKCLARTRKAVLDVLSSWAHGDDKQSICWLDGPAGSGKSAISQTVAEACAEEGILAASFFFSRKHSERSNSSRFFPTLALQLSTSVPETRDAIRQAITDNPLLPDEILRNQYNALIASPLLEFAEARAPPMIIIIDALDECEDDILLGEMLSLFIRALHNSPVRFRVLITSRPLIHVEQEMSEEDYLPYIRRVELRKFRAEDDIRIFLRESFSRIYAHSRDYMDDVPKPWPSEHTIDGLVDNTSGLFLFASTVINFINPQNGRPDVLLNRLMGVDGNAGVENAPFAGMDRLYLEILSSIKNNPEKQSIMRTIVILLDPLTINALGTLLAKSPGETRWQLRELQSVIAVPDDEHEPVRILHASFRDFLLDPLRSSNYCIDRAVSNGDIARLCLKLMAKDLRRDPCGIQDPTKMNRDVKDLAARCSKSLSGATQYACQYWASHLSRSDFSKDLAADLEVFAAQSLLYWVEALSLLGKFDEIAISSLHSARTWIKNLETPLTDVLSLIEDAERLSLEFFDPIADSAMHLYHSALPFSPSATRLRRTYAHELVGSIPVRSGLRKTWGKCIRSINTTGPVRAMTFSPDNMLIASRSDIDGVQLWRSTTGAHFVTLGGKNNDTSILTVSHDMTLQSHDLTKHHNSVPIWTITQYLHMAVENAHCSWAIKASATLAGWMGKAHVQNNGFTSVQWHRKNITPISLVFGYHVCVLRDLTPRSIQPPFILQPDGLASAFSPNGSRLAIGSQSNEMSIYDPNIDSDVEWSLISATDHARTEVLGVSDDGSRLLIKADMGTSLLDSLGSTVAELSPKGVTFANIARHQVPAQHSNDFSIISMPSRLKDAIHLFDGRTGAKLPDLKGKDILDNTKVIAFSRDDQLLVSGDDNGDVKVWSLKEMKFLFILENIPNYKGEIRCVAFAPDGKSVAAGNEHGAILCWKFSGGKDFIISPNPHPETEVTALVYTPDSACVVSGAGDGSLRRWHMDGARPPWLAEATSKAPIKSLSFQTTHDLFRLYCRSESGAVEIWEFPAGESEERTKVDMQAHTEKSESQICPTSSWRSSPGCLFADQAYGSNISLGSDGWLLDGESKLCWLPKHYRPRDPIYYRAGLLIGALEGDGSIGGSLLIVDLKNVRRT
ncbi:WD40 repeat-like protein [Athelia psychrophila]|uniref:WD40 repeat-like protein n=1 Tax=Athelia psychrophila TaxID=1759441 RepID=A0A166HJD9_9AGAM|nr:WD40 repeat-like protein [Fibularhizoctonia sp. CBS 109695]